MTTQFGPNVGAAIDIAANKAGQKLQDKTSILRPVVVVVKGQDVLPGKMTVVVDERHEGIILVGPSSTYKGDKEKHELVRRFIGARWVQNPVRMDLEVPGKIAGSPSIAPAYRILLTCPNCGQANVLWSDKVKQLELRQLAQDRKNGEKNPLREVLCRKCISRGRVVLNRQSLRNTLVPDELSGKTYKQGRDNRPEDPLFSTVDEELLNKALELWKTDPEQCNTNPLPRIWACYTQGEAPSDWVPEDGVAAEIERRVNRKGWTIRPFHIARKEQNAALQTILMEAPCKEYAWYSVRTGWVTDAELRGLTNVGYTRRFLEPRKRDKIAV